MLTRNDLVDDGKREIEGLIALGEKDLEWVVEATRFQLRRRLVAGEGFDLDYLGRFVQGASGIAYEPGDLDWPEEAFA